MARFRFPMFLKFWVGCAMLAALLIVGGVLVVRSETRMKSRGNYLEKHFKRYEEYQEGVGRAVSSVADVLASDMRLRQALTGEGGGAAAIAQQMYEQVSGKNGVRPELFVVFDQQGLVWAPPESPIDADDLRELEPVGRVRQGTAFFNKVLIHHGHALQLAGVPIPAAGEKRVVGGLLIGVDMTR